MNFRRNTCLSRVLGIGLLVLISGCSPQTVLSSSESARSTTSPATGPETDPTVPPASSESVETDRSPTELSQTPATEAETGQYLPISAETEINGQKIQLEVARTLQEQAQGLMHRPPLPDDRGMLFPFDPPRPVQFWMKNTPSPLDMVFLRDGEIQAIVAAAPPCEADPCPTYGPETPVAIDQVLELRSGRASELGLAVGDRLEIQFLN